MPECGLGLAARFPRPAPDQLGLDGLEVGFDCGLVLAVTFAAHRHLDPLLTQDFLIVMRTVLAAPVGVMDTALRR
jgi:hypothetical protein